MSEPEAFLCQSWELLDFVHKQINPAISPEKIAQKFSLDAKSCPSRNSGWPRRRFRMKTN